MRSAICRIPELQQNSIETRITQMTERIKQAIRIYLRPEALRLASIKSAQTGKNMSETIEQLIKEAHFADYTNNNNK